MNSVCEYYEILFMYNAILILHFTEHEHYIY